MASVREYQTALDRLQEVRDQYQELKGRITQVRQSVGNATVEQLSKQLKTLIRKREKLDVEIRQKCKEFLDESGLDGNEDEG